MPALVTPARTTCPLESTNRGPPESPRQVFELEPASPIGCSYRQHTSGSLESHGDVVTEPPRLTPASLLKPFVVPNPMICPGDPGGGVPCWLMRAGWTTSTDAASRRTAMSARVFGRLNRYCG